MSAGTPLYGIRPTRPSVRKRARSVELTVFLPSGVMFPLSVSSSMILAKLKDEIWRFARNFPMSDDLTEPSDYVLSCVMNTGEDEELIEEGKQLADVDYYMPILCVRQLHGNTEERLMMKRLNIAAGMGMGGSRYGGENKLDPAMEEVMDFKQTVLKEVCEPAVKIRCESWLSKARYQYGCEMEPTAVLPECILKLLTSKNSFLIHIMPDSKVASTTSLMAKIEDTVDDLLKATLLVNHRRKTKGKEDPQDPPVNVEDYVLKITGREELLLGNCLLVQYTYIRQCLAKGIRPDLVMLPRSEITFYDDLDTVIHSTFSQPLLPTRSPDENDQTSLWSIENPLTFKIVRADCLNVPEDSMVRVHVGIYHGSEALCSIERSRPINTSNMSAAWNERVVFSELHVKDIPRSARLAIVIYTIRTKRKQRNKESKVGLQWANLPLFDYRRRLRTGTVILRCWPCEGSLYDELHPIGTTTPNPSESCTVVELEFPKYGKPVVFPSLAKVLERAADCAKAAGETDNFMLRTVSKNIMSELLTTINRDRLYQLEEQNKEILWRFRANCMDHPASLPKLLQSVKWSSCDDVASIQALVNGWRPLEPEKALELLDYSYTDENVRDYAIRCLDSSSDEQLLTYLPQLVQVLKYESYLDCSLGRFLLRRALLSRKIGNFLFWFMRAEMHTPEATRYGLLLEAYCRCSVSHMNELIQQINLMEHFNHVSMVLQGEKYEKKAAKQLKEPAIELLQADGKATELCQNFLSPLHPSIRLGPLQCEKVKVFDSKKRPILVHFTDVREHSNTERRSTGILFKIGDDLRQDMLTLQLLRVMERLWQQEGYELKMNPYACLSMGHNIGMIELVQNSSTISNIQKASGKTAAAFKQDTLWRWLQEKNNPAEMDKVVENFTLSCAAYCVATFVLGVGDRHNDNIMVTTDGQLFHIDFGHFLGNFKEKLKVKREISPFILDTSFVHIITYGGSEKSDERFQNFRKLMETLYCILYKNGNLFINLFAMMLSTGIPELKSLEDIHYFRDMLALSKTEEDCRKFFQSQVDLVLASKQQLVSKVNWMIHSMAKD